VLLGFVFALLRHHDRRALRVRGGACKLHRRESGGGKQNEAKFGHGDLGSRKGSEGWR
jgi:hypothetical protein